MPNSKLGLPIEYQQLPEYFDAHNTNEQTNTKNALIEKLLRKHQVKTVLDITCGTGSQAFYLQKQGYQVIGSDFSPALLETARKKAKQANLDIKFIDGDMRSLQVGKFDAVISIFSAVGHLEKPDLETAFDNIGSNLKEDGIYIFDNFNPDALTDEVIKTFVMDIENTVNGIHIRNQQHSEIDRENNRLISHDCYILSKPNGKTEAHKNTFSLQLYTADEIANSLKICGFEVIKHHDLDGNDFIPHESLNILTVAKKTPE